MGLCMKNRLTCRQGYCGGRGDICSQVCIRAQCTIGSDRVTAKATDEIAAYISRRKTTTGKICTGIPDFPKDDFQSMAFSAYYICKRKNISLIRRRDIVFLLYIIFLIYSSKAAVVLLALNQTRIAAAVCL